MPVTEIGCGYRSSIKGNELSDTILSCRAEHEKVQVEEEELVWCLRDSSYVRLMTRVIGANLITYRASACEL